MNISEETFEAWSKGPSKTETEKCENAEVAVRKALNGHDGLSRLDLSIFAQGSYRARTNVRQDSDVDICVRHNEVFFTDYPNDERDEDYGNVTSSVSYADFKDMVGEALSAYFGTTAVTRGNKAFDIHANTYRIDADVVPAFEHRRYLERSSLNGTSEYLSGIAFIPDQGDMVRNWPNQNYSNGVEKNEQCSRHYKRVVRILKRLRHVMREEDIAAADPVSSFLIECLVWNAPNEAFQHESYTDDVRYVIADLWNRTRKDEDCSEWGEVNELKYLFRGGQPWTRQQANDFLQAAWDRIGFT